VLMRHEEPRAGRGAARGGGRAARAAAAADGLDDAATELFAELRAWRAATAKEAGVPAYVVFHDATLREVAQRRPASLAELGAVSGVGASKLEKFGAGVLEVVGRVAGGGADAASGTLPL